MACDFDIILNPDGPSSQVEAASGALDIVHELEQLMSVYRSDAALSVLNQQAALSAVSMDPQLFAVLRRGREIADLTDRAFDPAAGSLVSLWRRCRQASRIPTDVEVAEALSTSGMDHVQWNDAACAVSFDRAGVEFNLGAIGKGYAVDCAAERMQQAGVNDWLIHGGRSSIRAAGCHGTLPGWPVGLRNPVVPDKPFATLLLQNEALGTSGTAVQWFRFEGRRYGHLLDPRTGWPVESMVSVSVIAPDAALADALSTAFFVLGVEKALGCCDNFPSVGAIFFPPPKQGRILEPYFHNVPAERVFFEEE